MFDKRKLKREIERDRKRAVKARLAELRDLIKVAREERKLKLLEVQEECRAARQELSQRCAARREEARSAARDLVGARRRDIRDIQSQERVYREVEASDRRKPRLRKAERRAESDDEVRANLPLDLVPVFDVVRRHIKGSPRISRTEAFLQWAEENPDEVWALRSQHAERDVERLLAEQERLYREQRRRRSAVPF